MSRRVCKVFVTKHYAPMVPAYQFLSQVSSLVFISTPVMLDVLWIRYIVEPVNICRLQKSALSRKLSRSNSTVPYSIRVYNFN